MTLARLLGEAGQALAGVSATEDATGGLIWDRTGRPFATSSADALIVEFRLDAAVAAAALRTPDTMPSRRGRDWIGFSPTTLDEHASDRAEAWFASAWRRAERP